MTPLDQATSHDKDNSNDASKMMQLLHMAGAAVSGKAAPLGDKARMDMG
jgi:hypothetical protein